MTRSTRHLCFLHSWMLICDIFYCNSFCYVSIMFPLFRVIVLIFFIYSLGIGREVKNLLISLHVIVPPFWLHMKSWFLCQLSFKWILSSIFEFRHFYIFLQQQVFQRIFSQIGSNKGMYITVGLTSKK